MGEIIFITSYGINLTRNLINYANKRGVQITHYWAEYKLENGVMVTNYVRAKR